jgi:hypothetical protein
VVDDDEANGELSNLQESLTYKEQYKKDVQSQLELAKLKKSDYERQVGGCDTESVSTLNLLNRSHALMNASIRYRL